MIFCNKSKATAKPAKPAAKPTKGKGKKKEQGGDYSDAEWIMLLGK